MSSKNRFLDIRYLWNTFKIKTIALIYGITRNPYPFDFYRNKVENDFDGKYKLTYRDTYEALSYLNIQKAENLHRGEKSITQKLIIALVYYNDLITNQSFDKKIILKKAEEIYQEGTSEADRLFFYITETYEKFDLEGRYASGIVQGKAASLFIRCYIISKEPKYLEWARHSLKAAWHPIQEKGCLIQLPNELIWIEEYPSPKPSMVLNGFLFFIIGLAEYVSQTEDDEIEKMLELSIKSVLSWLPYYKQSNNLLYSMYHWDICNVHYTGIMHYLFKHLHRLTNVENFNVFEDFTNRITPWISFEKIIK